MNTPDVLFRITIDGTEYTTTDSTLIPEQLRRMAQLPATRRLLLLTTDGDLHPLNEGEPVTLKGHGIEAFISRDATSSHDQIHYKLQVDHDVYETRSATLDGRDIKALAGLPATVSLYRVRHGTEQTIDDQQQIDLSSAGIEQFTTRPHTPAVHVSVTVTYTMTARSKTIIASLTDTLQAVVAEAYSKLKEDPRDGDALLTGTTTRTDLRPYLNGSLQTLLAAGLVTGTAPHLMLAIDIDPAAGGA